MTKSTRRIVLKGIILSLALNIFMLFSQYHQLGYITRLMWYKVAFFFAACVLLAIGTGLLLGSLKKVPQPKTGKSSGKRDRRKKNKFGET